MIQNIPTEYRMSDMDRFITYPLLTVLISGLGGGRVGGVVGDRARETAGPANLKGEDDMQTLQGPSTYAK